MQKINIYKHIMKYNFFQKEENLPFVTTWINLEDIMLSEYA